MNALFIGLTLVAGAPALKGPAKDDNPPILGIWSLTEWYIDGQAAAFGEGFTTEFRPEGKRILVQGVGDTPEERGYKLHHKTKPAAIDYLRPSGGGQNDTFLGIYKVEGDTLTIALANMGAERPKDFEKNKDGVWTFMTFKKVKK